MEGSPEKERRTETETARPLAVVKGGACPSPASRVLTVIPWGSPVFSKVGDSITAKPLIPQDVLLPCVGGAVCLEETAALALDTQGAAPRSHMGLGPELCHRRNVLKLIELPRQTEPMVQLMEVARPGPAPKPLDQSPQGGRLRAGPVRGGGGWSCATTPRVGRM